MLNDFRELVRDTLFYLKDPLCKKQSILTNADNHAFFQKDKIKESVIQKQQARGLSHQPEGQNLLQTLPSFSQQHLAFKERANVQSKMTAHNVPLSSHPVHPVVIDNSISIDSIHSPIKKTIQRIAPNLKLTDQIPDDDQAKQIANGWKEKISDAEVVLIVCDSSVDTLEFLKGLAKAIDQHLVKVKILMAERFEREKRWQFFLDKNSFRLIIASDRITKLPELMRFYKSVPAGIQFFLGETPLLVLSPFSVYKSVEHKALLWKTLCQMLKK